MPAEPHCLSAISSANAMSSSASVAPPLPGIPVPSDAIAQFIRPLPFRCACEYFHRSSNSI